jgi:ATP-dependent exoDNAse (exonuclease V) alpha subunit
MFLKVQPPNNEKNMIKDTPISHARLRIPDNEFDNLLATCTAEQLKIILIMKSRLDNYNPQKGGFCIQITGSAGTGKSHIIKLLDQMCMRISEQQGATSGESVILCAPTGKAAFNIGGRTVHSVFHIVKGHDEMGQNVTNELHYEFRNVSVIVIDESSMLSKDLFIILEQRCRIIYGRENVVFGGYNILLVGDPKQLGPVGGKFIFEKDNIRDMIKKGKVRSDQVIMKDYLWSLFEVFFLNQVVRQDGKDVVLLNALGEGKLNAEQLIEIKNLINTDAATDWTLRHLAYTNRKVDEINQNVLYNLPGQLVTFNALDKIQGPVNDKQQVDAAILSLRTVVREPNSRLETKLQLKVLCKVTYVTNKMHLGLYNGAQGKVCAVKNNVIYVDFEDIRIGEGARAQWSKSFKES